MKKKLLAVFFVLVLVVAAAVYLLTGREVRKGYVETSGVIEALEVDLEPKISARIVSLCCRVGDPVKAGQVAFTLDSKELEARVDEARANLRAAREAVRDAKTELENARLAKEAARYALEASRAETRRQRALMVEAKKNLERARSLVEKGFISARAYDAAQAAYDAALAGLNSYEARVRADEAELKNARVKVRAATVRIRSSRARMEGARASLRALEARLEDTTVVSPVNGLVSYRAFEEGELPGAGEAVYTVYDPARIWARVDVPESELGRVKIGARAEVRAPGAPSKVFDGLVEEISELAGFATHKDVVRAIHDIKTFRVKVRIERPEGVLKPGMTADVRIFP